MTLPSRRRIADICRRSDYWRRSPASAGGRAGHKEWQYFYVAGDDVELVVNFSIMDSASRPGMAPGVEQARVALLVRTADGRWHGDLETADPRMVRLVGGQLDVRFDGSTLMFADDAYHLHACVRNAAVTADLVLRPAARPALVRSVPLGAHEPLQWFVVPRLLASGEVTVGGRRYRCVDRIGYHDHNWGRFDWGGDFAWEWGVGVATAATPWTVIFYRITDRGRHTVTAQGLLVWRGPQHVRTFRDLEVTVRSTGLLRAGRCLRVPRIMSLAVPGTASDIPARLEVEGRGERDAITVMLDLTDCAQIGVPNAPDDGMTLISECRGRASVRGWIRGEAVQAEATTLLEFNRAG